MYIPLLLYGTKCAQQLSYGFNILEVLEGCPQEIKIPYGDMDFSKKVSKVTDFMVVVGSQNLRFFLFRISSQIWRFSQKLRFSHFSFGLIFKRISSQKKASLARATGKRPLLFFPHYLP